MWSAIGTGRNKRKSFTSNIADTLFIFACFYEWLHMDYWTIAARKRLPPIIEKMRRCNGRHQVPLFAVFLHEVHRLCARHMLERYTKLWVGIEKSRQYLAHEESLTVVWFLLFIVVVEMHFSMQKKRHADLLHFFQHILCFEYRAIAPLR